MMEYSVLMSVYAGENAGYFRCAAESMLAQTAAPAEFVLVCDGPLTPALDAEVERLCGENPEVMRVVRLPENRGLGLALRQGLETCRCELVARMDSDDIALDRRMEHQLAAMAADETISVLGMQIAEFTGTVENIRGYRTVPLRTEEVRSGAAGRNPMNHMTVLLCRSHVLAVGNYQDCKGFEDYHLWARMLAAGYRLENLPEIGVMARVTSLQARRGGMAYFRRTVEMERFLLACGLIGHGRCGRNIAVRFCGTVLLPGTLRDRVYRKYLRQTESPPFPWAGNVPERTRRTVGSAQ